MGNYRFFLFLILAVIIICPHVLALDSKIPKEGTVFVGENDLDISECNVRTGDEIAFWSSGSPEGTPDSRAKVMDVRHFFVDPTYFSGKTGTWYGLMSKKPVFKVEDPWLQLDVIENGIDHEPEWIKKGNLVSFKISTNMHLISGRPGSAGAPVKVNLTGPNESAYSHLVSPTGEYNLENIYVYYSPFDTGAIWETKDETKYPEGEYTAWATCNVNGIHEKNPGEGVTITPKISFKLSKVQPEEEKEEDEVEKKKKESSDGQEEEDSTSGDKAKKESGDEDGTPETSETEVPKNTPTLTPEQTEEPAPVLTLDITPDTPTPTEEITPKPTKASLPSPPKSSRSKTEKPQQQPLSFIICIIAVGSCLFLASKRAK